MKLHINLLISVVFLLPYFLQAQFYTQKYQEENYFRMVAVEDMDNDGVFEVLSDNETGFYITKREGKRYVTKSLLPQLGGEDLPYGVLHNEELISFGDVDGNGRKDMIMPDGTGNLLLYKQDQVGNYSKSIIATGVSATPRSILKDIDGDLDPDIISFYPTHLKVFINSDGTNFVQDVDFGLHTNYVYHYVEDLDKDGIMEIILLRESYSIVTNTDIYRLNVFHYDSTASTLQLINSDLEIVDFGQPSVQFNDLDADGDMDFIAYWRSFTRVYTYINEGDLSFTKSFFDVGVECDFPKLTDINMDGNTDLIIHDDNKLTIIGKDDQGIYSVLRNHTFLATFYEEPYSRMVDFDQDGDLDLLTVNILVKNTDQWNTVSLEHINNCSNNGRQILDIDGDNDPDMIIGNWGGLYIMEQHAPFSFHFHAIPVSNSVYLDKITPIQFDADPAMEFLATYKDSVMMINQVAEWEYEKQFLFRTTLNNLLALLPGDMDNDGDMDFVHYTTTLGNNLEWYENKGSGVFVPHVLFNQLWWINQARLIDFDTDGDLDIVALAYLNGQSNKYSQLRLYTNDGAGVFTFSILAAEYRSEFTQFFIEDLDLDDDLDFLVKVNAEGVLKSKGVIQRSDGSFFLRDMPGETYNMIGTVQSALNDENIYLSKYSGTQMGWFTLDKFLQVETHSIPGKIERISRAVPVDFDMDDDLDLFVVGETNAPYTGQTLGYLILENVSADSAAILNVNVFLDKNKNGIQDVTDEEFGFHSIRMLPENSKYFSSNPEHEYQLTHGTHEILIGGFDTNLWEVTTGSNPRQFTLDPNHPHQQVSFGLAPKVLLYKVDVDVTATPIICNRSSGHVVELKNTGTINLNLADSYLRFDPDFTFLDVYPDPVAINDIEVSHQWSDWKVNSSQDIHLYLQSPDEFHAGEKYYTQAEVVVHDSIGQMHSFFDTVRYQVLCAVDPNAIDVSPHYSESGYILNTPTKLEYIVYFQNNGNLPAENVRVQSQLSPQLDLESVEIVSSSHPQQMSGIMDLRGGLLTMEFAGINLPDTSAGWAESQGYVKYAAWTKSNLLPDTIINGEADIYFDLNQPIRTNEIENFVTTCPLLNNLTVVHDSIGTGFYYLLQIDNPILDSVTWKIGTSVLSDSATVEIEVPSGHAVSVELMAYSPLCLFDTIITLGSTAVDPSDISMNVLVYPTVTEDLLHIEYDPLIYPELEYIIFQRTGIPVTKASSLKMNLISTRDLLPGLYFLQIKDARGKRVNYKFVRK